MIWVINSLIAVGILVTLFVFGEPVTKTSSSSSVCYWRHRSQADVYLLRGSHVEAETQMRGCLRSLGRPLPTTKLDLVASLFWNVIRQVLHRAGMCRWIEVKAGTLWRNVTQQEIKVSARDATVIYHKLLQLHLTDHVNQGMWAGLNLALCAVNLADVAGDSLPRDGVAEIYVLAAMTIRFYFTARLQFFARYFLSRARRKCLSCPSAVTMSLQWLCHPIGHRYFVDAAWSGRHGNSIYSCCVNDLDPLAHITRGLREHIMEKAVRALVTPGYKDHIGLGTDNNTNWIGHNATEALTYIHLLTELSSGFETCPKIGCGFGSTVSTKTGIDELSRWWAGILAVAAHWLAASDDALSLTAAERFYSVVDSMPKTLQNSNDPFIKCLYIAYKARRLSLHGSSAGTSIYSCLQLCTRAGELLSDSINHPDTTPTRNITTSLQLVVCDWLLNTRTEVWLAEHGTAVEPDDDGGDMTTVSSTAVISGDDLSAFQHDLTSLRCLAHSLKAAVPRVFLHEATLRLMTGANPVNVLYNRSLRRRRHYRSISSNDGMSVTTSSPLAPDDDEDAATRSDGDKEMLEERDRAGAILQACRHHLTHQKALVEPTNVAAMLDEAAAIYAKLGDRKAVQDCRNVMMKLSALGDIDDLAAS
jgi:sterol regulatory element-binding transcription factor 1